VSGQDPLERRWVEPVTLEGRWVRLEPLGAEHLPGLVEVGLDPSLWRWTLTVIATPDQMRRFVEAALAERAAGDSMPFTIIERASGQPVGSTRYLNIDANHRRLEIGYTWVAPGWQRTPLNSEAKLLLIGHAFDRLGAVRVEFKTDSLNEASRRALLGIGAIEEGTLRNHMISQGGRRRHSVYYSVIEEEWPTVRDHLEQRLARGPRTQSG
jgi:RimJ/RimL family protein N-acetyltransferase